MPPPDAAGVMTPDAPSGPALAAAVLAAASGSQLEATLRDIVTAAVRHVDAEYGALGVLSPDGRRLDRFVTVGMDEDEATRIGRLPGGHGILGLLVAEPGTLRLEDLGRHPAAIGFPRGHPPMRSFLGVPVRVGDVVFGNLYLSEKRTGGAFTRADAEVTQALAAVAGLAIENARLAERTETRRRWGQAATELATALLSGTDPDEVLRWVSARVASLTGADMAGVLTPSVGDPETLTIAAAVGPAAADVEGVRLPLVGTYVGATQAAGIPRMIDDIGAMPVVGRRAAVVVELTTGMGPALLVPVGTGAHRGLLVTLRTAGAASFEDEDLDLLAAFAAQASVVLELARAQQRERELELQTDRDRIARDLHDHVVQRIFATALSLDRLGRSLESDRPEAAARLARSVDELDGTMTEIRSSIFELHRHDDPTPRNIRHELADVVHRIIEGRHLECDVRFRGVLDELPRDLVPDLLAVVRELVTNVVRHAHATQVTVTVGIAEQISVLVADNGSGPAFLDARSGLANLADRAERRGGGLTTSSGNTGTEVCWRVPRAVPAAAALV